MLLGNGVGRLDHGPRSYHRIEAGPQPGERLDHRHLGDGVEVASLVEDQIDMGEGLETPPNRLLVLRIPLATVRIFPLFGLRRTTTRSASPNG